MRCSLNNHPEGYAASPLRWLAGLVLSPYVKRHWNLSNSQKDRRWSHRAIAVIQAIPFGIGLAASLLERVIVFFGKSQRTPEASQKTNDIFKKAMGQKVKPTAVSAGNGASPLNSNEFSANGLRISLSQDPNTEVVTIPAGTAVKPTTLSESKELLLHSAVIAGDLERCRKLLGDGADVNTVDKDGFTALMIAGSRGHKEICKLLIDSRADVNIVDKEGRAALIFAASSGHGEICKLLIDSDADVNIASKEGQTALMIAALYGRENICKLLIDSGADVSTADKEERTALMIAGIAGHEEICKLLIDNGADVNIVDKERRTALRYAIFYGYREICKLLIDSCADVNIVDKEGRTALMIAGSRGHKEICKLLIDIRADVNIVDKEGRTALMIAGIAGHKEICKLLIDSGADVNIADKEGRTALIDAASRGHKEICELLIDSNADVSIADKGGFTALMYAATSGHEELAQLLFDKDPKVLKKRPNTLQYVDVPSAKEKYKLKSQKERLIKQLALVWGLKGTINSYSGPLSFEGENELFSDRLVKDLWSNFCLEFQGIISEEASEKIGGSLDVFGGKDIGKYLIDPTQSNFLFNVGYREHAAFMWISGKKVIICDGGGHDRLNKTLFNQDSTIFFGTYNENPMSEALLKKMTALINLPFDNRIDSMREIVTELGIVGDDSVNSLLSYDPKRYPSQRSGNCPIHNRIYALKGALDYSELSSEARFFVPALRALVLENFIDSYKFDATDPVDKQMLPYLCQIRIELSTELCIGEKREGVEVLAGSQHSEERFVLLHERVSEKFDKAVDGWVL